MYATAERLWRVNHVTGPAEALTDIEEAFLATQYYADCITSEYCDATQRTQVLESPDEMLKTTPESDDLSPEQAEALQAAVEHGYCRTPLGFLMEYHRPGVRGAAEMSLRFSVFCVGCCWALFAVMVVVGSMNILWMAGITVVLSLERVIGWGDRLAKGVGVVSGIGGGVLVLIASL